jgi:hypothetical protein
MHVRCLSPLQFLPVHAHDADGASVQAGLMSYTFSCVLCAAYALGDMLQDRHAYCS